VSIGELPTHAEDAQLHDTLVCYLRTPMCTSHGYHALNQLQPILRVGRKAESVLDLHLSRLDEQALEISSPRLTSPFQKSSGFDEKERWSGCQELAEEVQADWDKPKLCLQA
jgi:hypothetical protein